MSKATLSKMAKINQQISDPKAKSKAKAKKAQKKQAKVAEQKIVAPVPKPVEVKAVPTTAPVPAAPAVPEEREGHIPRGERGDFLKTTITIPAEMFTELRMLGLKRKAAKQLDTDTSALIREALADFLKKHKSN